MVQVAVELHLDKGYFGEEYGYMLCLIQAGYKQPEHCKCQSVLGTLQ
jgi:hypothetical protein